LTAFDTWYYLQKKIKKTKAIPNTGFISNKKKFAAFSQKEHIKPRGGTLKYNKNTGDCL
jgi:hypothetical protein